MSSVHVDTQVAVWLYAVAGAKLAPARKRLHNRELRISPMAVLELHYLFEIGRTTVPAMEVVRELGAQAGLRVAEEAWEQVMRSAMALTWTRDPFDRLITAQALLEGAPLVTTDDRIRANCKLAVWD